MSTTTNVRELRSDLRYAARALYKNAGFTSTALATLTVGIGITAAVFTVVNGVLFRPLPYRDPSRIEIIWLSSERAALGHEVPLSTGFYADLDENQKSFSQLAAFQPWTPPLSDGVRARVVAGARVRPSLFVTLGVRPALGRDFTESDAEPGASPVVLISDALWRERFGADPAIVGKRIDVGASQSTVIGVMPTGFAFPRGAELPTYAQFGQHTDLWAPLTIGPVARSEYRILNLFAVGRLTRGVTATDARGELASILELSLRRQPRRNNPLTYDLIDMKSQAGRHIRGPLLFLMAGVLLVLLIACANVTNLIIARTSSRRREFAVRAALGASNGRITRQLAAENLLLAALGALFGVAISVAATRAMLALVPGSLPRADDVGIDWHVAVGAVLLTTAVAVVLAGASGLHIRRRLLGAALRDTSGRSTTGRGAVAGRNALVVGQTALATILLIGALLLTMSFMRLQSLDPGFQASNALTAGIVLPIRGSDSVETKARIGQFYTQLVEQLAKTPGVENAAVTMTLPLTSSANRSGIRVVNDPPPEPGKTPLTEFASIGGDYFRTMGVKVIAGRSFTPGDGSGALPVVIVNRAFEHAYLRDHAIDRQLLAPFDGTNGTVARTIVGVVDNVASASVDDRANPQVYLPEQQVPFKDLNVVVRTTGDPLALTGVLERAVAALDPRAGVGDMQSLQSIVDASLARQRFSMIIMTVFAVAALFLTTVGLYGVVALNVGERRREIGVRIALGARGYSVIALVVGHSIRIIAGGLALGLAGAYTLHRFVSSLLFGVTATNGVAYGVATALIAGVAIAAAYLPARRAAALEPSIVLRTD